MDAKAFIVFGLIAVLAVAYAERACSCNNDCPAFKPYCIAGTCRCSAAATPSTEDHPSCLRCTHLCSCPRLVYNECINGFCGKYNGIRPTPTVTVTVTSTITRLVPSNIP
ncbi:uncharacterized protein LOC122375679 [Amphibalanus amphitrite]|uniref:uncharacterized protein LOC122375679 n=1 Tax=Amphibalanus amphitrite TaxID=1232801 RepID=UPI001C90FFCA|nr:uncharacterized protein LOC122375679 [Amphibalanus amphitrite]